MTEEEKKLMEHYGITTEVRCEYHYKGYKYRSLDDALNTRKYRWDHYQKLTPRAAKAKYVFVFKKFSALLRLYLAMNSQTQNSLFS